MKRLAFVLSATIAFLAIACSDAQDVQKTPAAEKIAGPPPAAMLIATDAAKVLESTAGGKRSTVCLAYRDKLAEALDAANAATTAATTVVARDDQLAAYSGLVKDACN